MNKKKGIKLKLDNISRTLYSFLYSYIYNIANKASCIKRTKGHFLYFWLLFIVLYHVVNTYLFMLKYLSFSTILYLFFFFLSESLKILNILRTTILYNAMHLVNPLGVISMSSGKKYDEKIKKIK